MGRAIKHPVPAWLSHHLYFWHPGTLTLSRERHLPYLTFRVDAARRQHPALRPSECSDVKNYKRWLNPFWHKMRYSRTHMATVGVKGLNICTCTTILFCTEWAIPSKSSKLSLHNGKFLKYGFTEMMSCLISFTTSQNTVKHKCIKTLHQPQLHLGNIFSHTWWDRSVLQATGLYRHVRGTHSKQL